MSKLLTIILAIAVMGAVVGPIAVSAIDEAPSDCNVSLSNQRLDECKVAYSSVTKCNVSTDTNADICGMCCLMNVVYKVTDWIFFILIILSALMIIWGGLQYILAAGDPAKAGKGKTILTLSIIGIAIALLAKVVPSVLKFFLGV